MAAPKGNRFWEARSSHGRKPIWDNPQELYDACVEYFEWVEANPLWETKPMIVNGEVYDAPTAKMRAMTIEGLCVFLGIARPTWDEYKHKQDFSYIVSLVNNTMYEQKLTGAASGLLVATIIQRELGLKEASSVTVETPQGIVFNMNYGGKGE
jgi:hypothetical protein